MPRSNKRSRIKGLPPKALLQAMDAHSGSFPTISRTVTDNRTGRFNVQFDDTKTINFTLQTGSLGAGVGLTQLITWSLGGNTISSSATTYVNFGQDMSSSLTGVLLLRKGIADTHLSFDNPNGQAFQPFKEDSHQDTKTLSANVFYASGSSVDEIGTEGFESPLWSKTKIVIDLTPKVAHSVAIRNHVSTSRNYPMAYWNNDLKVWEGIGTGKEFSHEDYFYTSGTVATSIVTNAYEKFFKEQTIGFGGGFPTPLFRIADVDTNNGNFPQNAGAPIDNFMFPAHNKYAGSSSNLIDMSQYIDQPFVLEKIVLEISCGYESNRAFGFWTTGTPTESFLPYYTPPVQICNFFILNQSNGHKQNFSRETTIYSGSIISKLTLSASTESAYSNSTRELVTWADVCHAATYTNPESVSDYLVQDGFAYIYPGSITGNRLATYYSRNFTYNFTAVAGAILFGNLLAAGVIGSQDREFKMGNSGSYSYFTSITDYKAKHPEFDSVAGHDGTLSGQYNSDITNIGYQGWNRFLQLSMSCKAPIKKQNTGVLTLWDYYFGQGSTTSARKVTHGVMAGNNNSGRGFNNKPSGRDFKNNIRNADETQKSSFDLTSRVTFTHGHTVGVTQSINAYKEQQIVNPYLLLPSDKLIFGWQLPVADLFCASSFPVGGVDYNFAHTLGPEMTFAHAPAKITLYGSYIKEGKEHHDTLNQLLTSNAIHEIIG